MIADDRNSDGQLKRLIVMNSDITEAYHPLQNIRQRHLNPSCRCKQAKNVP